MFEHFANFVDFVRVRLEVVLRLFGLLETVQHFQVLAMFLLLNVGVDIRKWG